MTNDISKISCSSDLWLPDNIADIDRRDFVKYGFAGLIAALSPALLSSPAEASRYDAWRIDLHHAHTDESFSGVYRVGDKYLPEAFERLNYVMRDFRTGEAFPMDPRVIDIISMVQRKIGRGKPVEILSAYRSPKTNKMLRTSTRGVARNSFHMYGQALDIRIPGISSRRLRNTAKSLKAGGVGYYPRSGFVHVDTGKVRTW